MRSSILFLLAAFILLSCDNKVKSGKDTSTTKEVMGAEEVKKPIEKDPGVDWDNVVNDINIKTAGGMKVKSAYLSTEDGVKIGSDNAVSVGEKAVLHLVVDGWLAEEGKTFIGASEKISASDGKKLLDATDLFQAYDATGVDPEDAKLIRLSAVITSNEANYRYFNVVFRVWDKKGKGEISGSYRLNVK